MFAGAFGIGFLDFGLLLAEDVPLCGGVVFGHVNEDLKAIW